MATHGTGVAVKTRLYMEGTLLENAMVSLAVNGGVNSPASCQLELVPTDTIRHIMPGTWVHVFTTDPWEQDPKSDLSDYKLLFEGVVISRGFVRHDDGRNFTVQCAAPEVYWTTAKQFWLNIGSANGDFVQQMTVKTSGGFGGFGKVTSTGTFGYMMSKMAFSKKNAPEVEKAEEAFLDVMVSVLDDIGNVNPYYTNARNRMRLTDRIIRAPAGKTAKLFKFALLSDFLDGLAGRKSGQTNLVEVVNQLLGAILHEWVSIVAPPYVKADIFERDVFGNIKRGKQKVKRRGPRGRTKIKMSDTKVAEDNIVASIMFKPHVYTIDPPNFNVLFPNMYDQASYSEDFLAETTRLSMRPQLPMVSSKLTSMMLLQRPAELEVFTALIRDPKRKTNKKRTPDGKYAGDEGQAPTFTDYDWTTNEERIRGIVYNFINMAPAPSALTLTDPGKKLPNGARKGGVPAYLQNVASYEYYKSKFMARQSSVQGPFNMRPVPGFPMVMLDDSQSKLNVICYLDSIQHSIDASGSAMTRYGISYPRIADEIDYNRPKFKQGYRPDGELNFDLFRSEDGSYDFASVFDGTNQPPIPEWFDQTFRNTRDLDLQYQEWFGPDAAVIQTILFVKEDTKPLEDAVESASEVYENVNKEDLLDVLGAGIKATGAFINSLEENKEEMEEVFEAWEKIPIEDAIEELNRRYAIARGFGKEFEEASSFTKRSFTKIDEAFRFVGAAPLELADRLSGDGSTGATFKTNPAGSRVIDYKKMRMEKFVGDISFGSGYSGVSAGDDSQTTEDLSDSPGILSELQNRMSGAFPDFDTKIHTGDKATDQKVRNATAKAERAGSGRARYDGRPLMFDFEYRLWQESIQNAGFTPGHEKIGENSINADYIVADKKGNVVRHKTRDEVLAATKARLTAIETEKLRQKARAERRRHNPAPRKCPNMAPKDQAPTGDGLEQDEKKELPQPLSEMQVVELRRSIIEAYQTELKRNRGFTG